MLQRPKGEKRTFLPQAQVYYLHIDQNKVVTKSVANNEILLNLSVTKISND